MPSHRSSQAEAPLLPGALQVIPVPACSHAVSVSQVLQLLQCRKVLLLSLGPYLEHFWCFISTRCLVLLPRCVSQKQTNSSPQELFLWLKSNLRVKILISLIDPLTLSLPFP